MKKFIVLFLLSIFIYSCGGDAFNNEFCLATVKQKYRPAVALPRTNFCFIAVNKNGDIVYVETMDMHSTKITQEIILINKEDIHK